MLDEFEGRRVWEICSFIGIFPFGQLCLSLSHPFSPSSPPLPPTWLFASLPASPCNPGSVLHSFSICWWLPTCCLGNPRILCAEWCGSVTFHSYLNWEGQASGWEESWIEQLCCSCLAIPTLKDGAEAYLRSCCWKMSCRKHFVIPKWFRNKETSCWWTENCTE